MVIKLINNNLHVNPVGLAKPTWLVMTVSSVNFVNPTGLRFMKAENSKLFLKTVFI